jgi:CubicO group peptidase (beta-lactamase class C family)
MSAPSRALPERPSLRYLKLEAKRRVCSGEYPTLHDAQLAIAREHGLRSWTGLKRLVTEPQTECHAVTHLRWLAAGFVDADQPAWIAPGEAEFREHFTDRFLARVPAERLAATVAGYAVDLRGAVIITPVTPLMAVADIEGVHVIAMTAADPPHRLNAIERIPLGSRITDVRVAEPPTWTDGDVPEHVRGVAGKALTGLGLPGLVLAGVAGVAGRAGPDGQSWALARGWADLDTGEVLTPGHLFPAGAVTTLVTAVAMLRIVADGGVALDDPASRHLRSIRLSDDEVSIRELLTHTGGVVTPTELFAASVPRLTDRFGPVLECDTTRGSFRFSLGGYAALGQVIEDITGSRYADAIRRLVHEPLGMSSSSFPGGYPPGAVVGHEVAEDGSFLAMDTSVCTLTAGGGMWTTASDLVRFCLGWESLLPAALAGDALRPQVGRASHPGHVGLGWLVAPDTDLVGSAGGTPGTGVSVLIRRSDGAVQVTMANRQIPVEAVGVAALRPERHR